VYKHENVITQKEPFTCWCVDPWSLEVDIILCCGQFQSCLGCSLWMTFYTQWKYVLDLHLLSLVDGLIWNSKQFFLYHDMYGQCGIFERRYLTKMEYLRRRTGVEKMTGNESVYGIIVECSFNILDVHLRTIHSIKWKLCLVLLFAITHCKMILFPLCLDSTHYSVT
jgi:hypothetical protein